MPESIVAQISFFDTYSRYSCCNVISIQLNKNKEDRKSTEESFQNSLVSSRDMCNISCSHTREFLICSFSLPSLYNSNSSPIA